MTRFLAILAALLLAVLASPTTAHADLWCVVTFADTHTFTRTASTCFPLTDAQLGALPRDSGSKISPFSHMGKNPKDGTIVDFTCFKAQADCHLLLTTAKWR